MLQSYDLELMNQFIDKFSIEDEIEFKKETEVYATQLSGMTVLQFKGFISTMKTQLSTLLSYPVVVEYLAILNRMEKVL